jgi:hypothetical protein
MTLSQGPRLNARTTRRIHTAVKHLSLKCTTEGISFQGRDVSVEAVISAVLIELLALKEDEQISFLETALKKLEAELV